MRLVLLGGGTAHLQYIRDKAKNVGMDVEIILVSPTSQVFYKPAFDEVLRGQKNVGDAIIDLRKISTLSGVTFIQAEIDSIDTEQRLIKFIDRASIQFDFLSIEGIEVPKNLMIQSVEHVFQVHDFIAFFQRMKELEAALLERKHYPYHIAVVGAGRTGVHLIMGLAERFKKFSSKISWELLEKQDQILPEYHPQIRRRIEKELRAKDLLFHTSFNVQGINDHILRDSNNAKKFFDADIVFSCAGTELPRWLKNSDLPLTNAGALDTHVNLTLKQLPYVIASGEAAGRRYTQQEMNLHVRAIESLAQGKTLDIKKNKIKLRKRTLLQHRGKTLQVSWGLLSEKEKPYAESLLVLNEQLEHLRGLHEQRLAQLSPQVEENSYVEKFKKRLLLDLNEEQLEVVFSERLPSDLQMNSWCEKEYRDVFNDHYLSSHHTVLDILDQSFARGGAPKYLRLYISAPSTIKDVEILSQIVIGAFRACDKAVELRVHLCGQSMNTVQFSLGVELPAISNEVPAPVAYIALTRPFGLYGLLSQQGKEGWDGQWLSDIWQKLLVTEKNLSPLIQKQHHFMEAFQLSENGFINDLVKNIGNEGWRVCLNLSQLPRWEGVDQILKRRPQDILLQKNWQKGFRYWAGQGERIPDSQYLLWEPHLIRPPTCILVDPAYSKELSLEFKNRFGYPLTFIGYAEKLGNSDQTSYKLSDWDFENREEYSSVSILTEGNV